MTTRRLLLLALLGAGAWGLYVVADRAVEALWEVFVTENFTQLRPSGTPDARDWTTLVDLRGTWDFRIGDDPAWAATALPEAGGWGRIAVPAAWENEGFHGYDGYGWYRTTFTLDDRAVKSVRDEPAFLLLGRIDDTDEVWLNGVYLGRSGRMPPLYATAAFSFRTYRVPPDLLRLDGENVLAVRVYDANLEGGILEGPVSLAVPTDRNPDSAPLLADLAGSWRFRPGDDPAWAAPRFDDADWDSLRVPAVWDTQGYAFDGYGWYRTSVTLSDTEADQDLVLVLGAIDDLDQTFVNGVEVGATGDIDGKQIGGDEWQVERAYPVPRGLLQSGPNVIAVRVYDGIFDGGIYRGPVGLMRPEAYDARRQRGGDIE